MKWKAQESQLSRKGSRLNQFKQLNQRFRFPSKYQHLQLIVPSYWIRCGQQKSSESKYSEELFFFSWQMTTEYIFDFKSFCCFSDNDFSLLWNLIFLVIFSFSGQFRYLDLFTLWASLRSLKGNIWWHKSMIFDLKSFYFWNFLSLLSVFLFTSNCKRH